MPFKSECLVCKAPVGADGFYRPPPNKVQRLEADLEAARAYAADRDRAASELYDELQRLRARISFAADLS